MGAEAFSKRAQTKFGVFRTIYIILINFFLDKFW